MDMIKSSGERIVLKTRILQKYYFLLSSVFIFLSFPSYDFILLKGFVFFAWICLAPLFLFVRDKGFKDLYLYSFITGLAGNFLAFQWIGNFGAKIPGGYLVIVCFLIPTLAVFFAVSVLLAEILSRKFEKFRCLIYPSVWISVNWVQSLGFMAFPWTYLGYSQYNFIPFIQMASFTGIMGVTFLIVMFNSLIAEYLYEKIRKKITIREMIWNSSFLKIMVFSALMIIIIIYGFIITGSVKKASRKDLRVSVVQSCISPWENWNFNRMQYLSELQKLTIASLSDSPEFIIWSESATLEPVSYNFEKKTSNIFQSELLGFVKYCNRPLLTGEIGIMELRENFFIRRFPQNNAVLINGMGDVVKSYAKINLVPFGEWFPYEKWFPVIKDLTMKMGGSSFIPGDTPDIFTVKDHNFGVLICYEGMFYRLCRQYKKLGADFLVNITNDGWTDTYNGHMQHFSASVFRAIENGIWLIRAGNTGYSASIDPFGRVRSSIPILKKGYLTADMDFDLNRETFYSMHGDVFLYFVFVFLGVLVFLYLIDRYRFRNL